MHSLIWIMGSLRLLCNAPFGIMGSLKAFYIIVTKWQTKTQKELYRFKYFFQLFRSMDPLCGILFPIQFRFILMEFVICCKKIKRQPHQIDIFLRIRIYADPSGFLRHVFFIGVRHRSSVLLPLTTVM